MMTRNVQFKDRPEEVMVQRIGDSYLARVDIVTNIAEKQNEEEETYYEADVYTLETKYSTNLKSRILADKDKWIAKSLIELPANPTIQDAIDAINVLTEIVLGDE